MKYILKKVFQYLRYYHARLVIILGTIQYKQTELMKTMLF